MKRAPFKESLPEFYRLIEECQNEGMSRKGAILEIGERMRFSYGMVKLQFRLLKIDYHPKSVPVPAPERPKAPPKQTAEGGMRQCLGYRCGGKPFYSPDLKRIHFCEQCDSARFGPGDESYYVSSPGSTRAAAA